MARRPAGASTAGTATSPVISAGSAFDHYTGRPTLWMARDENGERITEAVAVQVAGDPDLHTHFTVMNAVFCESGRVGSMDLDRLDGLIKEGGALYQAHLATNLRGIGAEVVLDPETGAARLTAIPENVRDHFSKKTLNGEEAARAYAKAQGLDWDELSAERRVGLLKAGAQGMPTGLDAETLGKLRRTTWPTSPTGGGRPASWAGSTRRIITQQPAAAGDRRAEQRLELAYPQALPWLEKDINRRAVISEADAAHGGGARLHRRRHRGLPRTSTAVTEMFMAAGRPPVRRGHAR